MLQGKLLADTFLNDPPSEQEKRGEGYEAKLLYLSIVSYTQVFNMTSTPDDILWTIKIDRKMDEAVQKVLRQLGYKSKAELTREAIREFLIRRKLFSLLGGEVLVPVSREHTPEQALTLLMTHLEKIPLEILDREIQTARSEVARELLDE